MKGEQHWWSLATGTALLVLATLARGAGVDVPSGSMSGEVIAPHATTRRIEISMVSDEYNAMKDFTDTGFYEMRVPGGDWNYEVLTRLELVDAENAGGVTKVFPGSRDLAVEEGGQVGNDYKVTGNIRVHIAIKGDPYQSWSWSGPVRTGGSVTDAAGTSVTPRIAVMPGEGMRVTGQIQVSGVYSGYEETYTRVYDFQSDPVTVEAYETRDLHITIRHEAPEPHCSLTGTCEPVRDCEDKDNCPTYGHLRAFGDVRMDNITDFRSWRVNLPGGEWTDNDARMPRFDRVEQVLSDRPLRPQVENIRYRGLDGGTDGALLGALVGESVNVTEGETLDVDLSVDTGVVIGRLDVNGIVPDWMDQVAFYSSKTGNLEGDEHHSANARNHVGVNLEQPYNQNYLTPGDWAVGTYLSAGGQLDGAVVRWSRAGYNDSGNQVRVLPGSRAEVTRKVCLGEAVLRFRDKAGGQIQVERVQGQAFEQGVGNASFIHRGASSGETVEIRVNAPEAEYTANASLRMEDGTRVSAPPIEVPIQCGVRSCADEDAPVIAIVDTPEANLITNAGSIEVRGTARDEDGVSAITINGHPAEVAPTGTEGEVGFRYQLPLDAGENRISAIAVDGKDYGCFNERSVFVDRWQPSVRIRTPEDGLVYQPGEFLSLDVVGEDRGYGYRVDVRVDGELIASEKGRADAGFATLERITDSLIFFEGAHTVTARVTDRAGNSAEQSITVRSNRPPLADAGSDSSTEAAGATTLVMLDGSGSRDADGDSLRYRWVSGNIHARGINPEVSLTVGRHDFELTVTDEKGASSKDSVIVEVVDTTPPRIESVEHAGELWPPNHKMVHVASITAIKDLVDGKPSTEVLVTSDEAAGARGAGHTEGDWEIVERDGGYDIFLRAERSGPANGRTYNVAVVATDQSGNRSEWRQAFQVIHDKGN